MRYDISISMKAPETFTVRLMASDFEIDSKPFRVFQSYADFLQGMGALGLDNKTIKKMIPDVVMAEFASIHQIELSDHKVWSFTGYGMRPEP